MATVYTRVRLVDLVYGDTEDVQSQIYVAVSGAWKLGAGSYVAISGTWKEITDKYICIGNTWKLII